MMGVIAVSLLAGAILAPHFGQGIDEESEVAYGESSLQAYRELLQPYRGGQVLQAVGPFYLMVWVSAARLLENAVPAWSHVDARHFVNFVVFQAAVLSVYVLARKVVRPTVAVVAAMLFETQPLLLGHAFINHKDTSLMGFFAVAMVLGFSMVDRYARASAMDLRLDGRSSRALGRTARESWHALRPISRAATMICLVLALGIPLLRQLLKGPTHAWLTNVVNAAYHGTAWPPLNRLFQMTAENALITPVSAYVGKATLLMDVVIFAVSFLLLALAAVLVRSLWADPALRIARGVLRYSAPAAIVLGMTLAVRTVALFGVIVIAGYSWIRAGRRSLPLIATYGLICGVTAYFLWPQMWASPIDFLRGNLASSLRFPAVYEVLFRGQVLDSISLPRVYVPWLLATQLTLPALGLCLLSVPAALRHVRRHEGSGALVCFLAAWFLIPVLAVVFFQPALYNNFRHLLFILPPLFVLGAIGLERLHQAAGSAGWLLPVLSVVLLAPGLVAIVRLHPYEYIYYNELVGGVRGASGEYELDYWCTSYREAASAVNAIAPTGSTIAVWGPVSVASPFLRPDLTPQHLPSSQSETPTPGSVAMGCSWATMADDFLPSYETVWTVERDGVSLALVKRPSARRPAGEGADLQSGSTSFDPLSQDLGVEPP
jgi:hypothetical protein